MSLIVLGSLLSGASAFALEGAPSARELRVCADPNNLPFSNAREEGFENVLARLVADALDAKLTYTWLPQRRGFIRNTLKAGRCDLMIEAPVGFSRASTTRPYYRSSYVFVSRKDRRLSLRSFDDPKLRHLKIGIQTIGDDYANAPPADALAARGLGANVVGYPVYGDYSTESPLAPIVAAVARGDIDVAAVWGPAAGWLADRQPIALAVVPIAEPPAGAFYRFTFDIAMGVRKGDEQLRRELDAVIATHSKKIRRILAHYHVPLQPEN
jgi:quinoprotein dehydrogenase-associated probable ABC transporter substrate-binding protein